MHQDVAVPEERPVDQADQAEPQQAPDQERPALAIARLAADELGVEFLGSIELNASIREGADTGQPVVVSRPDSPEAQAFLRLAEQVAARCSVLRYAGDAAVA